MKHYLLVHNRKVGDTAVLDGRRSKQNIDTKDTVKKSHGLSDVIGTMNTPVSGSFITVSR